MFMCAMRDQVSLEIWFNWSSSPTATRIYTHNLKKKLLQLHLQQCAWTEHISICFIFMLWLFMCAKRTPLNTHTHTSASQRGFYARRRGDTHEAALDSRAAGILTAPSAGLTLRQVKPGTQQTARSFTCTGDAQPCQCLSGEPRWVSNDLITNEPTGPRS